MDQKSILAPSIICRKQLQDICSSFVESVGIKYFSFYIIFNNNQRFVLSTTPEEFIPFYWDRNFYKYDYSAEISSFKNENYYLCNENIGAEPIFKETLEAQFKLYRLFYIERQCSEGRLIFGTLHDEQIENPGNFYHSNIDNFENFCIYFLDSIVNLIKFYNPQYDRSIILNDRYYRNAVIKQTIKKVNLSDREVECLWWAAYGKSSDETAKILKIKKNTVEDYRKSIKKKLNCVTIAQAVYEGFKLGYIGAFHTDFSASYSGSKKQKFSLSDNFFKNS